MKKRLYGTIQTPKRIKCHIGHKTASSVILGALAVAVVIITTTKMPEYDFVPVVNAETLTIVTAYNPGIEAQTDDTPCIGASMLDLCRLVKYHVPVCASNDYPLGTKIKIEDYGDCYVLDRMAKKNNGKIDIAFEKLEDAKNWGVKRLNVYE